MPWVRFIADFDFKPKKAVTIAHRAGELKLVTTACSRAAIGAGKAEATTKPRGAKR